MEQELLRQLDIWHDEDKHEEIVRSIQSLPGQVLSKALMGRLGRALNNLDRYGEALEVLQPMLAEGGDDPLLHFRVGYANYYLDRDREAERHFRRTVELDPADGDAWYFLEQIYTHYLPNNPELLREAKERLAELAAAEEGAAVGGDDPVLEFAGQVSPVDEAGYIYRPGRAMDPTYVPVEQMTQDSYYPPEQVAALQARIGELAAWLGEDCPRTGEELRTALDGLCKDINHMQEEFEEKGSEIETVARECIAEAVGYLLQWFDIPLDIEDAIRCRDW